MAAVSDYTAICERVGKWWEITVPELDEVTQARRLSQVDSTVRDLIRLMTGARPDTVHVQVRVPGDLEDEVARARKLREHADAEIREAAALSRHAARRLHEQGLPLRDIGEMLGVSFQRAKQLVDEATELIDA